MTLVEREAELGELSAILDQAAAGNGHAVVVTGEAGAGKTALVRRFASDVAGRSKFLWGMCDELLTPRPLGPFRDISGQLSETPVEGLNGPAMVDALVAEYRTRPRPIVVVIEDIHWADAATVDAVRFIGRRIGRLSAMLVMTVRDNELHSKHPLRSAFAAIPPADLRRIELGPLSHEAVAVLAGRRDIADLYELTGGNPFFVSEVLAAPDTAVPATVQDAVLARIGRLDERGRECVETAAVVPGRAERWLLEACGVGGGVEEGQNGGLLRMAQDVVSFTHELARRGVERSLTPSRREALNKRVLDALIERQEDPARLVHHASEARDSEAVARFAPAAARQAASLDARREAADHFRRALEYPESYPPTELASLHYEYARECSLTERHDEAERALDRAAALHAELGDESALGTDLSLLSNVRWALARGKDAEEASVRAITVLERRPPSAALGRAYEQRARLALVDRRLDEAVEWGDKATSLARAHNDVVTTVDAAISTGWSRWMLSGDKAALLQALEIALREGLASQAARAYGNLAVGYLERVEDQLAAKYLNEGLAYCEEHDLLTMSSWLLANRSTLYLEQGRWNQAEADARRVVDLSSTSALAAKNLLALLYVKQGREEAARVLDEARRLSSQSGDTQDLIPVNLASLELAWMRGELAIHADLAAEVYELARRTSSRRMIGAAALWLHRAGGLDEAPPEAIRPYALQIAGRWQEAAAAWKELGRPYREADALGEADEPEPLLEALAILDQLGARPRAAMVRRRLAEMGLSSVPRGPRDSTRSNVAGLTARQVEVLGLLAENLTYQEIARRLHLSTKTVDHHASAVRTKLDVSTSAAAVAKARELGILTGEA